MRQNRRGRVWHIGILFLIYSCLYVYSAKIKTSTEEEINEEQTGSLNELNVSPNPTFDTELYTTSIAKEETDMIELTTRESSHIPHHHAHPTWRPKRQNCTPPAIEQFPQPLMGPNARKHGGLVIHVIVAIFTFLGLAIVCDDYFVSSLDRICEELKLSPDVAGATFMAAGSSAPELATVVIGVFFAKDDIGVSGVIGSAVFNIMFVISVCALCSGTVCQLNWWPLVRDCFFYSVSILVMLIIIFNDTISWVEATVMLVFYVFYCIALHFNSALERWAMTWKLPIKLPTKEEQSALVTYKNISDPTYTQNAQAVTNLSQEPQQEQPKVDEQSYMYDANASWDPNAAWGDESGGNNYGTAATTNTGWGDTGQQNVDSWDGNNAWASGEGQQNYGYNRDGAEQNIQDTNTVPQGNPTTGSVQQTQQVSSYYKSAEPKNTEPINPLEKPTTGGVPALIAWYIVYPIHYMCRLTMPDCRLEKYRNWYPFTFLISMIWISFYSYFMVWMITIIGATLGIPDTVMGLTFVAAGVSVPDALSSIAVIKEGYGDMAVSNAIGSNVFDILICLGLPWFIQTAIIKPGSHVNVISKGLAYSTLSLLSTVLFLLVATHLNGWKLDKRLGIVLMVWYLVFITVASLYELNVFGQLNPPECPSGY
ncbi:probable sodium/potassium/calcium exchanger CG1090 isoform X1 [Phlebotomus papatasi]|uniref:probable sodium/potassium/calcium exchanger CG1090 isoform X1 n=1 Tax=Phlebotomus papatasi TaxID=29031 RepID=UPI00248423A9|nr:probable sodium/potassium/calcium exchanger CG1090 isoform X1 [Phlebotomus papatasi]XP_055716382.1 probable sodium/potassium/calcium exchanger CG1090 isoform X1 [Phlebotomus papatasi]XP_055716383.1 probable sodium/potassium/calcium exchanger CG1090 isoform X1 [Phlebotomus papatasi]